MSRNPYQTTKVIHIRDNVESHLLCVVASEELVNGVVATLRAHARLSFSENKRTRIVATTLVDCVCTMLLCPTYASPFDLVYRRISHKQHVRARVCPRFVCRRVAAAKCTETRFVFGIYVYIVHRREEDLYFVRVHECVCVFLCVSEGRKGVIVCTVKVRGSCVYSFVGGLCCMVYSGILQVYKHTEF